MAQATIDTTVAGLQGTPISATPPTVGQILVFNGTAWVPGSNINGPLTVAGGLTAGSLAAATASLTGGLTAAGNVTTTGAGVVQTPGPAGQLVNANGDNLVSGRARASSQGANQFPNFGATAPTQFGFNCVLTPRTSGVILVMTTGRFGSLGAVVSGLAHQLAYGTGAAPSQGAAASGNAFGFQNYTVAPVQSDGTTLPIALMSFIVLNPGTTYWFDMQVWVGASGQSILIGNAWMAAVEL